MRSVRLDSMELCTSVGFLFAVAAAVLRVSSSIVELSRSSVWGGAAVLLWLAVLTWWV